MQPTTRELYYEAEIKTATPQKLRLMLIDGALRFARQAHEHWLHSQNDEAYQAVVRCREIVTELLGSIRKDGSQLGQTVAALYIFLFKTLTEAQLHRDVAKLDEVIRVLDIERETWEGVCLQMPNAPDPGPDAQNLLPDITASHLAAIPPTQFKGSRPSSPPASGRGGFSLDA